MIEVNEIVKVKQIQTVDKEEVLLFVGKVLHHDDSKIVLKIEYENKYIKTLTIERINDTTITLRNNFEEPTILKKGEKAQFKYSLGNQYILLDCILNELSFKKDYIELDYNFYQNNSHVSHNKLIISNDI